MTKKELSLQLQGIMKIKKYTFKFRKTVSEVSSFVGNPVAYSHIIFVEPNHKRDFSVKLYMSPADSNSSHTQLFTDNGRRKMTDGSYLKIQGWYNREFLVFSVLTP